MGTCQDITVLKDKGKQEQKAQKQIFSVVM